MDYSYINTIMLALLLIVPIGGCLQNTCPSAGNYNGSLRIRFILAEKQAFMNKSSASDIHTVAASMSLDKADLSLKTDPVPFNQAVPEIKIDNVYPGKWHVTVNCYDANQTVIYAGNGAATIISGGTATLTLNINPAPGTLHVNLNAAQIPGFGSTTTGTVYIYEEAQGSAIETELLTAKDGFLQGDVAFREGTFQVKVAVPNITKAIFHSPYYTVDIHTGTVTNLNIAPDGSLIVNGVIDSTPATPTGLKAVYNKTDSTVALQWNRVNDSDLAGYRLYHTDGDGNFVQLSNPDKDSVSYTDSVSARNFYNERIGYTISSYDLGGNESFWSAPEYVSRH